jgi:hypothetical protein
MSIKVCIECKRAFEIIDDSDPFGRTEGVCKNCWDEKLDQEQHAYEDSKKPSPGSWDPSKEG